MAAIVSLPIVPLSGGSSHAAAGTLLIAIALSSIVAFMRASLDLLSDVLATSRGNWRSCGRSDCDFLAGRVNAMIGVDDLARGREPDLVVLLHFGERALEIFDAQRLTRDH